MDVFSATIPLANAQMFNDGMMQGSGFGFFGALLGFMFTVIFWILLIVGIFYLVKYLTSRDKENGVAGSEEKENSSQKAIDILKERYARGEIDKEEFDQKKKDLRD
ncbi:MAG: SHOCT domain-containing protein [Candidatus Moraniibacteriota bacterium]